MKKRIIIASVLCIVLGVTAIFAPACTVKGVEDTYINDNGEFIIVYTDGTKENLGVVKGKEGKDGQDLIACQHEYGEWQTEIEATCTSIGYETRSCSICGDIDYRFNQAGEHEYDLENAAVVNSSCAGRWVNATCLNCGDTKLIQKEATMPHTYEDGFCIVCGSCEVHTFEYEKDVEVVTDTCGERIINVTCEVCSETFTFEERPVIEHVYEDGVCTECGNLQPCDRHSGSWFIYCEECKNCSHDFISSEPWLFASESGHWGMRECDYCGKSVFVNRDSHDYDMQNAVDVISNCEERWVNVTCTECGYVHYEQSYVKHPYDENGVCTECGDITHFIESEEYFSNGTWWSIDRSYGIVLITSYSVPDGYMIHSYVGTPVDVIIPAGINGVPIKSIGGAYGWGSTAYPFENCESLESIVIPETVEEIFDSDYNKSFGGCINLGEITIKNPEIELSKSTFENTAYWNNYEGDVVYIGDICLGIKDPENGPSIVEIEDGTNRIAEGAFRNYSSLTKVIITNSVTKIGLDAFENCTSLTEVNIPDSVRELGGAFEGCSSLKELHIPINATLSWNNTIRHCRSIEEVTYPNTVAEFYFLHFWGCSSLKQINISRNSQIDLEEIKAEAESSYFYNDESSFPDFDNLEVVYYD